MIKTISLAMVNTLLMMSISNVLWAHDNDDINLEEAVLYGRDYRNVDSWYGDGSGKGEPVGYFGNGYERNFLLERNWITYGQAGPAIGDGYGMGGYSDPNRVDFSLRWCTERSVDPRSCTPEDPDGGRYEWRFIRDIGWRKFEHYGAARKDWWDFKNTIPWLRNGYGYGYPNYGYDNRYNRAQFSFYGYENRHNRSEFYPRQRLRF